MDVAANAAGWFPLRQLRDQFIANCRALSATHPHLAEQLERLPSTTLCVRVNQDAIALAEPDSAGDLLPLPNPVPAATAVAIARQLFPAGPCNQPVLVAGIDQTWLWTTLHELPVQTPAAPGHRPPLYFLARDLTRLAAVLHLRDLRPMLADPRVHLFTGDDAVRQFADHLSANPNCPVPRLSVTVEPALWSGGQSLDTCLRAIGSAWEAEFALANSRLTEADRATDSGAIRLKISAGQPLRVLGITSRFTTFLQYSMRDWLDSLAGLGHETELLIESADHEQLGPIAMARTALRFKPDLIVMIDHFRDEMKGLPSSIPCVMWVQDRLPNIFSASAGARQKPNDYVIGQGRTECVHALGYPAERFMPAMIGTNPRRFSADQASPAFTCDVSFVSHCTRPADQIVTEEIARNNSPHATRLLTAIFDQLRAVYRSGGSITQPARIEAIIRKTLADTETSVPDLSPLLDLFTHRINNALYRHQAIEWVAETGVRLHLYGRGWESHPHFARFARGVADNQMQLAEIYRSSAINLQVTPFGAAHQRLFDGLAAGGFFLLRRTDGDRFDQILRSLWDWCVDHRINNDQQLLLHADEQVRGWLARLDEADGRPVIGRGYDFVSEMAVNADEGFVRSAGTIWPEFDRVSFHSREELQRKIARYLAAPGEGRQLAAAMRERVLNSLTYEAISRRMLRMIRNDRSGLTEQSLAA